MNKKTRCCFVPAAIWLLCLLVVMSCQKEHSCESCGPPPFHPSPDTLPPVSDTVPPPDTPASFKLPACALCREADEVNLLPQTWNLRAGGTYLCGSISEASFVGGTDTITFSGPSSCSSDTILRITAYLPEALDADKVDIITDNVIFSYYDKRASKPILVTGASQAFYLTVDRYAASTKTVNGTFNGTVFTSGGSTASIVDGRFLVKLQ